ncbi:MAG: HEAT repeat domain-containing protein, partial [Verrucomicrobiota bacterium]
MIATPFFSAQANSDDDKAGLRMAGIQVPEGFSLELFAGDDQVSSPAALCFDDWGNLYVAESHRWWGGVKDIRDFPELLIEDLSSETTQDRMALYELAAERGIIPMETWTARSDLIRLLKDEDGDGRADLASVFADGFDSPLEGPGGGLLYGRDRIYYANLPHLWELRDENRDGLAEEVKSLQGGFGPRMGIRGHDLHGLVWGPDGRVYWSVGDRGYPARINDGIRRSSSLEGAVFRCEADGSGMEVYYTGLRNPQELAFDAFGNLFTGDAPGREGDPGRLVYLMEGGDSGWHAGHHILQAFGEELGLVTPSYPNPSDGETGPITAWLAEGLCLPRDEEQPGWILPPIGNLSWGARGVVYNYGGTAFPPRYDDHFFACNTGGEQRGNVDVFSVVPSGAGFSMQTWEKAWMSGAELTDVEFGPDGRLYLSNFPSDPSGKGAIFAVLDEQARQTSLVQETHELLIQSCWEWSDHDLSDLLSHEDYRVRLRAQFALVKKGTSSLKLFQAALEQDRRFPRKLHGLWGIGQLARQGSSTSPKQALVRALRQADPLIRSQAAKLIGDLQSRAEGVALLSLLDDADLRVQAWAAIGLGKCGVHEAIGPMLDALGRNADEDAFLRHGLV